MKLARGEKIVKSLPRSFIFASWLTSMLSRSASSEIASSEAFGATAGSFSPAIWRARQSSSAFGAVV
ncbi:hypothetical protein D3C83_325200 [compost metagenome]